MDSSFLSRRDAKIYLPNFDLVPTCAADHVVHQCRYTSRSMPPYRVGILTVSDTAFKNASLDKTGPSLKALVEGESYGGKFKVTETAIVPDEHPEIISTLGTWSALTEEGEPLVQLCITTGGTGFSPRDRTPEAARTLIVREATGLQHLLLSTSLQKTPMAALARPVAGMTADGMLIVTVPGSPKGALENAEAVLKIVPHALDLLSGGSGKAVHQAMGMPQRDTEGHAVDKHGITHRHHHHHNEHSHDGHHAPIPRSMDTSKGVAGRHRVSPYPIISLQEAFDQIFKNSPSPEVEERKVDTSLVGSILAEDVHSELDLPSTQTTNVDGYAIATKTTLPGYYPVLSSKNYPGHILTDPMLEAHIYRINTGAPLPLGTDAVVMVEDTELVEADEVTKDEKVVKILVKVPPNENVRMPGTDVKKGDLVLEKGTRISEVGGELGSLIFVGRKKVGALMKLPGSPTRTLIKFALKVSVYKRPKVAILSTGNELSELHGQDKVESGPAIYDSNRPSLKAALQSHGFQVIDLGIVTDDELSTTAALRKGCQEADMIITTGGTSMGESDLLKPVIERRLAGTVHFGRVAMKPGKPTTFATIPPNRGQKPFLPKKKRPTLVFALPGNPASALVTFYLFVLPSLRKMSGFPEKQYHLPKIRVRVNSDMRLDPRPEFHRVWVETSLEAPYLVARSTGGQRSSRTLSLAKANALICLPSSKDKDVKDAKAGEMADAILIGSL